MSLSIRWVLIFALPLLSNNLFSQSRYALSQSDYNMLLNRQFRLIMTGASNNVIGNFAAIDLSDSKRVTFAPTFQLKNNHLLSIKFNGGISDGFADIFTNKGLNSNLSIDAEYNFLRGKKGIFFRFLKDTIHTSGIGRKLFEIQTTKINHDYKIDSINIVNGIKRANLLKELVADSIKYAEASREADEALGTKIKELKSSDSKELDPFKGAAAIQKENVEYTNHKLSLIRAEGSWTYKEQIELSNKKIKDLAKSSEENLTISGFRMAWFTVGGQIRNDAFKLFDASDDFSNRIESENYVSFQGKVKYSIFNWFPHSGEKRNTWYMMFGFTYNFQSNYQDLTFSEITVTTDYGSNASDNMTSVKKYNVYSGEYRTKIDEAVLSYDAYFFINNIAAFHIFPVARYTETYRPRYNMGFGFLYPIKNKEDKPIINAEVYANFVNLFRYTGNSFDLFQNCKVGLRFSVPFEINQVQKQKP